MKLKVNSHFGVKTLNNGTSVLFYAVEGSFASDAWIESDKRFAEISGETFLAITADDGKKYNIGKRNIRRVSSAELERFLNQASPAFQLQIELIEMKTRGPREYCESVEFREAVPNLLEQGFSAQELKEYYETKYC